MLCTRGAAGLFVQDAPGSGQFGNKSRDAATWPAVTNQLRITSV